MLAKDNIVSVNSSFFTSKRLVFLSTFFLIAFLALLLASFISLQPLLIIILYAIGFSILEISTISLLIFDFRVDWHNKQSRFIILLMIALSVVGLFSLFWASIIIGTIFLTAAFTLLIGVLKKYIAKWEILFFILPIISLIPSYLFFSWLSSPLLVFTCTFLVLNGLNKLYRRLLAKNNNFTRRSVLVVFSIVSLTAGLVVKQDFISPILVILNITSMAWVIFFISLSIIISTIFLIDIFGVLKVSPPIPKQDDQLLPEQPLQQPLLQQPQQLLQPKQLPLPDLTNKDKIVDKPERKEIKEEEPITINTPVYKSKVIQQKIYQPFIAELVAQMVLLNVPFKVNDDFLIQNEQFTLIRLLLFYLRVRMYIMDVFCTCYSNPCVCMPANKLKKNRDGETNFKNLMNNTLDGIITEQDSIVNFYAKLLPSIKLFLKWSNIDTIASIDIRFFINDLNIISNKGLELGIEKQHFTLRQLVVKFNLSDMPYDIWFFTKDYSSSFNNFLRWINGQPSPTVADIKNSFRISINQFKRVDQDQSAHTTSIHLCSSYHAIQLRNIYYSKIFAYGDFFKKFNNYYKNKMQFEQTINYYKNKIQQLFPKACDEAIKFIFDLTFTDPTSKISIRELLIYLYLQIEKIQKKQDENSFNDTKKILINGLNDIMHDVDNKGNNTGGHICLAGAFNKLIEIITITNCTAITMLFISQETILNKFYVILQACIKDYLNTLNNLDKLETVKRLSEEGVNGIWPNIKVKVEAQVRAEFMIKTEQFPCIGFSKEQEEAIQRKIEETNQKTNTQIINVINYKEYMIISPEIMKTFTVHQVEEKKEEKEEKYQASFS